MGRTRIHCAVSLDPDGVHVRVYRRFYYGTQAVFLNGFNVPWIIGKGCDFGEGLGTESLPEFKKTITEVSSMMRPVPGLSTELTGVVVLSWAAHW